MQSNPHRYGSWPGHGYWSFYSYPEFRYSSFPPVEGVSKRDLLRMMDMLLEESDHLKCRQKAIKQQLQQLADELKQRIEGD